MAKENFGQAMNELFGVGKANGKTEEKPEKAAAKTENVVKEAVAPAAPTAAPRSFTTGRGRNGCRGRRRWKRPGRH